MILIVYIKLPPQRFEYFSLDASGFSPDSRQNILRALACRANISPALIASGTQDTEIIPVVRTALTNRNDMIDMQSNLAGRIKGINVTGAGPT